MIIEALKCQCVWAACIPTKIFDFYSSNRALANKKHACDSFVYKWVKTTWFIQTFRRKIEIKFFMFCFCFDCCCFLKGPDFIASITKIEHKLMKCDPRSIAYDFEWPLNGVLQCLLNPIVYSVDSISWLLCAMPVHFNDVIAFDFKVQQFISFFSNF